MIEKPVKTKEEVKHLLDDALSYMKRVQKSRFFNWMIQHVAYLVIVSDEFPEELVKVVKDGSLTLAWASVPFPILIELNTGQIHYFKGLLPYGLLCYIVSRGFTKKLVEEPVQAYMVPSTE